MRKDSWCEPRKRSASVSVIDMEYPISYEHYDVDEIVEIIGFLNALETMRETPNETEKAELIAKYRRYRDIVNNLSEEKRIDKAFEKQTGISIYKTMKNL